MFNRTLFFLICIYYAFSGTAQQCNCVENFDHLKDKITTNYIGYALLNSKQKKEFKSISNKLRQKAIKAEGLACFQILHEWIEYFKDNHTGVYINDRNLDKSFIRNFYNNADQISPQWNDIVNYFKNNKTDIVEGVWENLVSGHQIYVTKDKNSQKKFTGVVLKADSMRWMPGQIRWKIAKRNSKQYYSKGFYNFYRIPEYPSLRVEQFRIIVENAATWRKIFPIPPDSVSIKPLASYAQNKGKTPIIQDLGNRNVLISIPYCDPNLIEYTDSLVNSYSKLIEMSDHLIIDLRNNTGGTMQIFNSLYKYLFTRPYQINGGYQWATTDNIDKYRPTGEDSAYSMSIVRTLAATVNVLEANRGKIYQQKTDTIKYDSIYKNPAKVSLLVNRGSSSAAELFVLTAMQSTKVKVFGTNTNGTVDYGDISSGNKLPCPYFYFYYSLYSNTHFNNNRYEITGIPPDVFIPVDLDNWIEFVIKWRNEKK